VLPVEGAPIEDGAVVIEDSRIAAVGSASELGYGEHFADAAILPGLVNAHTHLEYAVYAGFGDGLADFADWISLHVKRKGRIGWDEFVAIARLGAAECLRCGVTTVGDASFSGAAALACAELGLRATVYLEVFGADPDAALARFETLRERAADAFSERVRLGVSPHAPYTVSLDVYRACAALGLPVATHLSESRSEVEYLRHGTGAWSSYRELLVPPPGTTGPRLLADAGLLGPNVAAAHCVVVDDEEIALLAEHGASVVHCARSNALLGCGIAPVAALRAAGVTVGLGTDSPASTPSFDIWEELRTALYAARAREQRPDALSAADALELATLGSARALGLGDEVGSLVPGKRADLTVLSLFGSPHLPWEEPAAASVLGGAPQRVLLTLVDGETRYRHDEDTWQELTAAATRARALLLRAGSTRAPT
jgi:cytosine/adenosine deaminase-related metal-dependent hydrolase